MRVSEAVNGTKRPTHISRRYTGKEFFIRADEDINTFSLYDFLLGDQYWKVKAAALRDAAKQGKKAITDALRAVFPRAFREENINKKGYIDKMSDAVQIGKLEGGMNHMEIKVHILGKKPKKGDGSGQFRLRFFEAGNTKSPERNKDGNKRGSVPALWFFRTGSNKINLTQYVSNYLDKFLSEN